MKKIGIVGIALAGLLLAGCSGTGNSASTPDSASPSPSAKPTETATPTPSPTPEAVSGPPEQCLAATSTGTEGDPIAAVVEQTVLPDDVHLMGTQTIPSTSEPGKSDAVVRICADPMTEAAQRELATTIARDVYIAGLDDAVGKFYVTAWIPDGESVIASEPLHVNEFTLYLWDSETANMDSNWKTRYDD